MKNLQAVKQRFGIIGKSEKLNRALSTAIRVSNTDLTVLITGESGVGKEVFSKIIHQLSIRKHNTFIAINCGAIPAGTINSELFGHEKGSFTGATGERKGYFETANGGTVFLDEVGEMPLDTQSYLLRVLETGEFFRVGSSKVMRTDLRVIAASNIELEKQIRNGKFREDLFYRLNTVPIRVPSLYERSDDIYMLFRKFAVDFAEKYRTESIQLDERAKLLVKNYKWPGNVRELKNVVEQLSILSEEKLITAEMLIELIPNITKRNLPSITRRDANGESLKEREILYKLLFDMKSDLNDLKSLVFELIRNNDLNVPDIRQLKHASSTSSMDEFGAKFGSRETQSEELDYQHELSPADESRPIILTKGEDNAFQQSEVMEENLSLEDMEKEMISKALKKYKGRRKDAAIELGISERTLYRKIKYYKL